MSALALAAVQSAIQETGYVANANARSLATRRTGCVAFVFCEDQEMLFEDPNVSTLIRSTTQALAAHDMHLMVMMAGSTPEREHVLRFLRSGHVDGALLVSVHGGDPILAGLRQLDVPVLACGRPVGHENGIGYVGADDRGGAREVVQYLADHGRRRIATITGPLDAPGGLERLEGYRDVVGSAPADLVAYGDYSRAGGEEAMARLLHHAPDLDAVFVASDLMAAGALATLRRAGRAVPTDVAVAGFDDSPVAVSTDPPLTTVRQPLVTVAGELVRRLVAAIDGEPWNESLALPTELVRRESA